MEYKQSCSYESYGKNAFGVQLLIGGIEPQALVNTEEGNTIERAFEQIQDAIGRHKVKSDPRAIAAWNEEAANLVGLFPDNVYIEFIPYEYCSQPCCCLRRWLNVYTKIGPIKIGWRKSVISIDWSKSNQKKLADDLFPTYNGTKYDQAIHAYGYEKAKEFLSVIMKEA